MPNMSYCRFENTLPDLRDCRDAMGDNTGNMSAEEQRARKRIIEICFEIAKEYSHEIE